MKKMRYCVALIFIILSTIFSVLSIPAVICAGFAFVIDGERDETFGEYLKRRGI